MISFASFCLFMILPFFCHNGSFPNICRLNNSCAGGTFVVECGVDVLFNRKRHNSCCHGLFSICAALMAFSSGLLKVSTSELPCGHNGVVQL